MRRLVLALTMVALAACGGDSTGPRQAQLVLENNSVQTIAEFYFSPCTDIEWGDNRLATSVPPGGTRSFQVEPGCLDMLAVSTTGAEATHTETLSAGETFTFEVTNF